MMPKYVSVNDDSADLRSVKSYTSDLTEVPLDETATDRLEETKRELDSNESDDRGDTRAATATEGGFLARQTRAAALARERASRAFAIRAALIGGLSGCLYGYDVGCIGEALPELRETWALTTAQEEMVVSVMLSGAVIGAAFGGFLTDWMGRWRAVVSTAMLFTLATLFTSAAHAFDVLLLGRFLTGIAVAWSILAVVSYLTEVSPVEHRGTVVCANDLMISVGVLMAYCMGWVMESWHGGWRYKMAFSLLLSLTQLALMTLMPESPRWYLIKNRRKEAATALANIYGCADRAIVELSALEETGQATLTAHAGHNVDPLREFRTPLLVAMGLFAFQQLCGQGGALAYMPVTLRSAGISPEHVADIAIMIGAAKLVSTAITMTMVHGKDAPRKPLLLLGAVVIAGGHFMTALAYRFSTVVRAPLTVVGTMFVICGYAVSYGPLIWVVSGEMFPTAIRGRALGLSTLVNWLGNLAVSTTFLSVMERMGGSAGFLLYGLLAVAGLWYTGLCVPETGGKTPEEVMEIMQVMSVWRGQWRKSPEPHLGTGNDDGEIEIPGVGFAAGMASEPQGYAV